MQGKKGLGYGIRVLWTLALIFQLALGTAVAETAAGDAPEAEENREWGYFTYLYDNSNGLPSSEANAVAQIGIGFIWIGGYSGLTRYDGNEFTHFDLSTQIASVNSLYVDSQDRLWVGTNDSGLAVRQRAQFSFWGQEDGLKSLSIHALCEDGAGNIIIGTAEGMAYVDPDGVLHTIDDLKIRDKNIRRLRAAPGGVVYGLTADNCIFAMENLQLIAFYEAGELGISEVRSICPDPIEKGKVYLGTATSQIIVGNMLSGMANTAVFCNQTIGIIMCRQCMARNYSDDPEGRAALMLDIENSVVTIAGLVPWCIASSVPLGMLGCGMSALPFAAYLYLIPLCWNLSLRLSRRRGA